MSIIYATPIQCERTEAQKRYNNLLGKWHRKIIRINYCISIAVIILFPVLAFLLWLPLALVLQSDILNIGVGCLIAMGCQILWEVSIDSWFPTHDYDIKLKRKNKTYEYV